MEDGSEIADGSHVEEKKLSEDKAHDEKVDKSELVGSGESRDVEDEVFEDSIGSREDLLEHGQNSESLEAGPVYGVLGSELAAENSNIGHEMENFEEAIGSSDGTSNSKEVTEDVKLENVLNKIEVGEAESEAVNGEMNGGKEESEVGTNGEAEASIGGDEVDVKSDVLVENPTETDSMNSYLEPVGGNLEKGNGHSFGENGHEYPGERELSGEVISRNGKTEESKENTIEDGNNVSEVTTDASGGTQSEKRVDKGEETDKIFTEMDVVHENKEIVGQKDGVVTLSSKNELDESEEVRESFNSHDTEDGDSSKTDGINASAEEASRVEDGTGAGAMETGSPAYMEKSISVSGLRPEDHLASQSQSTNTDSTEVRNNIAAAEENDREDEQKQGPQVNGKPEDQHTHQLNGECEQQQIPLMNKERETEQSTQVNKERGVQPASTSSPSSTVSRNPTVAPPAPPAGLGRAAPLLEPAPRVSQQPRVNGTMSHSQTQQAEDAASGETDEYDETREKLQMIRVKFLRLAHRLGQTPHNVVVAQVLYRLGLAEQLRGRNGSRVGAFSFDRASAMAEQLEAAGQEPLDFSCTIMVLGKTGVGKSATINSIFDEMKFTTDAFQMGTKKVQDVVGFVQGIKVRVIDTPGLLPSWSDQRQNEKILHSVRRFIKKTPPDIVLYLDRLDMQSRDFGDTPLLRTITDIFGPSIWFNAIVVLTHAASAPPDGPNGTASSYDMFVTQRSHVIQQAIRQAAGDMRLMNPVSLVENHSACRTNRAGQRVLPNGQVWKPHLLLLSFASKILAEANALLKLQDNNIPGRPFAARSKAPPLPFLLSSLLQSRPQVKLPDEQYDDEDDAEDDLDDSSDSENESEYDQLLPFKRLTKAQMAKLSRAQKKEYLDELEYREKLFMKKQLNEEKKRRRMMKKLAAAPEDMPNEYNDNAEEESGGPASVPVPMPDLALPASFDSDNPTHRYRCLDTSNQWLVRPVLETHGWDHDIGYEGVNAERLFVVKDKVPISFSGQVTKDKKDANVQMELASSIKHGECKSTSLGFDMQNVGKDLAYTLRSEMRFNKFRKNKVAAGLSVTVLGDSVSTGVKVEDKLIANKRFRLVLSGGAMTGRGDVAYGGSLEAQLRDKDYPLGRFLSTLGLSVMDWHGDLAIGGNIQSQVPIGRSTNLIARANLNNRGAGQVSIRLNSSEQLQIALMGLVPLFKKVLNYPQQMQYGQ